jgi:hypothetical protein
MWLALERAASREKADLLMTCRLSRWGRAGGELDCGLNNAGNQLILRVLVHRPMNSSAKRGRLGGNNSHIVVQPFSTSCSSRLLRKSYTWTSRSEEDLIPLYGSWEVGEYCGRVLHSRQCAEG